MRTVVLVVALTAAVAGAEKPRVFVTDSQSWQIAGGFSASNGTAAGAVRGGARPQTVEVIIEDKLIRNGSVVIG